MLLFHALPAFLPYLFPCFHNLCDHVSYLQQIIMVFHSLVFPAVWMLQTISMFFLGVKPFILYLPAHPAPLYQIFYIFLPEWQVCKKPELFMPFFLSSFFLPLFVCICFEFPIFCQIYFMPIVINVCYIVIPFFSIFPYMFLSVLFCFF